MEGDPVSFDAVKVGSVDYTFDVSSTTAEVVVKPPEDFTGTFEMLVRVRPESASDTDDLFDTQLVGITVI